LRAEQEGSSKRFPCIFLDEIQAFKGRRLYGLFKEEIFVAGLSSRLLREVASQPREGLSPSTLPLSLREAPRARGATESEHYTACGEAQVRHPLRLREGSFPDIVLGNIEPLRLSRECIGLVVYRGITNRFGLRNRRCSRFSSKAAPLTLLSKSRAERSLCGSGLSLEARPRAPKAENRAFQHDPTSFAIEPFSARSFFRVVG